MASKVGDIVEVPGGMHGTVKFVGSVDGKKGTFAGVQLATEYAARGKNSGEVDGKHYFRTTIPGSGIFLPLEKASKKVGMPALSTPKTAGLSNFNQGGRTPSLPKPNFSHSIGAGARAASPALKPMVRRESIPRPASPLRKTQTPVPQKLATPKTRPSAGLAKSTIGTAPQYRASPAPRGNKFSQSLRQSSTTPARKPLSPLGPEASFDEEADATPTPTPVPAPVPASRTIGGTIQDEEIKRLKASLEEREQQLKEQATSIADMENSLAQLSALLPEDDDEEDRSPKHQAPMNVSAEVAELREALRDKNEKIRALTAEFDANRADFRSTIDTLEMASTETERVYEKRVDELLEEVRNLQDRSEDVEGVAQQFKQLEELVQELEEGLEEARRGEAEARGEVEFLRGEVERGRSELRREKEKSRTERALNGEVLDDDEEHAEMARQLEQKEDEVRGLKAIIHSLNHDTNGHTKVNGALVGHESNASALQQQVKDLTTLLDQKNYRLEELEREVSRLQASSFPRLPPPSAHRKNSSFNDTSEKHRSGGTNGSHRLSDRTVVPTATKWQDAPPMPPSPPRPEHQHQQQPPALGRVREDDEMESSAKSTASSGALWCEICETGGHDILTCKDMMFGNGQHHGASLAHTTDEGRGSSESQRNGRDVVRAGLAGMLPSRPSHEAERPAPLVSRKSNSSNVSTPKAELQPVQNPVDTQGMVAGKTSGVVDADRWCALCERDGHESVDCPFEDAF